MRSELRVPDATCGHCKATIEGAVTDISGVHAAEFDLTSKQLVIDHDEGLGDDVLVEAIAARGYSPEGAAEKA